MKVIVCQYGARRRYAVARILEEAGMLAALYTDSSSLSPLGRVAHPLKPLARGRLRRLLERKLDGIPKNKIFNSDRPFLSDIWASFVSPDEDWINRYLRRHEVLSNRMIRWGFQGTDVIYIQSGEAPKFASYAKENGKKIIIDINSHPMHYRMLAEEYSRYPQWGIAQDQPTAEQMEAHFRKSVELGDILLCPSQWVADGVATLTPNFTKKIRVCPYGSSIEYPKMTNVPEPGRIFYCGSNPIMKGLPDVAEAANILKLKYPQLNFRVAGLLNQTIQHMPECRNLVFLGKLSESQMREEFLSADVFVLPTRSEGLASVLLEAVAAGCPVITTKCAGMNIKDSENGIMVSPGDVDGIAAAIQRVYSDRKFRDMLASNARKLAADYTMDAWKDRLVNILREF